MTTLLFVATMTGTAEMVAEEIVAAHGGRHAIELRLFEKSTQEMLAAAGRILVISSTYGEGEVPEPAVGFFEALKAARPDLCHMRYGVIALGDSGYVDTFAQGGRLWDGLLAECGAQRQDDILILDAADGSSPVDRAVDWAGDWLDRTA